MKILDILDLYMLIIIPKLKEMSSHACVCVEEMLHNQEEIFLLVATMVSIDVFVDHILAEKKLTVLIVTVIL